MIGLRRLERLLVWKIDLEMGVFIDQGMQNRSSLRSVLFAVAACACLKSEDVDYCEHSADGGGLIPPASAGRP